MGYTQALEVAGAEVIVFGQFGSYQGDWWALVNYQGQTGWVHGSYGSCSGCDAFEGEFGYDVTHDHPDKKYVNPIYDGFRDDCHQCQAWKERLVAFGESYLDLRTQEDAERIAGQNLEWDLDAKEMVEFIRQHGRAQDDPHGR